MAKFILAEKKEMTQKFTGDGTVIPVTKVVASPCVVTQLKTDKKDGYVAVQLGYGLKKNLTKPVKGHLKDLGNFKYLKEFKINEEDSKKLKIGEKITVKIFQAGDMVKVSGITKGKGFQGVVRRWGFHGSPATHGHKDQLRMPGSIGATGPQHVFKGMRMGGHMGANRITVKNLEIIEVDSKNNEIFIKGAVPGSKNNLLLIYGAGDLLLEPEKTKEAVEVKAEERAGDVQEPQAEEKTKEIKPEEKSDKEDENKIDQEKKDESAEKEAAKN